MSSQSINRPIRVSPNSDGSLTPLLKWPGGKRWLSELLIKTFPSTINRYYEPFLGGAAVFFALRPRHATLSDTNPELINSYIQLRDNPKSLLRALAKLRNSERDYYRIRDQDSSDPIERAARMIYLATLSFNGIFRQNLAGVFNVPYGKKIHLNPADPQRILTASASLQGIRLLCKDFEGATKHAKSGDLIYFDPPYTVAHGNNGFVKYNAKIFSWEDQIRLANTAWLLSERGCLVFISNADHESIRALYRGFKLKILQRHSKIAASSAYRKAITECLFCNAGVIRGTTTKHP